VQASDTGQAPRVIVSDLGIQLRNAKFVRRISRLQAEALVVGLLERVEMVNQRDELTHRVTTVRAFGSYVGDQTDLGDVDLAIQYTPRRSTFVEESKQRAVLSGRT
jgi:predicted nucleotidyltransferase